MDKPLQINTLRQRKERQPEGKMRQSHGKSSAATRSVALFLALLLLPVRPAIAADLQPAASAAFDRYVQLTEAKPRQTGPFLWIDSLPQDRREAAYAQLRSGDVVIESLDAGEPIPVPGGMIHHWIGTVFIPGATLAQVLSFEEDYDHQAPYFHPDVIESKILRRSGLDFTINIRFYKKKVITAVLDTDHEIRYTLIDPTHASSRSWTTRVQQIEHAGTSAETLDPQGHDDGFLWRMNTDWRFEEKDGGTYVESQSISLTRDIPTGLGWMIGPYISSVPRESLTFTLANTRAAILQKLAGAGAR
jgi:hypothetical protein